MKFTEAEKKAFILGMVSKNMPVLKMGDSDGIIDYIYDTVDARLGLRQYIEDKFDNIFDFCRYAEDFVKTHYAIYLKGTGGVTDTISSSIFNFTYKVEDTIGISSESSGSPFVMDEDGVTLLSYTGDSHYIELPDYVKRIPGTPFSGVKDTLRYIDLNNVEFIGDGSFIAHSKLTSVTFSGTQRCEIGADCFRDCTQLNCEIPRNIYKFGDRCFMGCSSLTGELDLESSIWRLNYIGNRAFAGTNYDTVRMTYMFGADWDGAFADMSQLSTLILDDRVYELPTEAFANSESLQVKDTEYITKYGERCFSHSGLTGNVGILHKARLSTTIEDGAFEYCEKITSLYIDGCVKSIGSGAFWLCSGIEVLGLGEGIESLGSYCFSGLSKLSQVKIPSTVTSLGDGVFTGCNNLSTIEAPLHLMEFESVLTDGNGAYVTYY